jgi:hypothetical protein
MLHVFKMVALTLSDLFASVGEPESHDPGGEGRSFTLLCSAQVANVGFALMVCLPGAMDALGRNRNSAVLLAGLLGLPYYAVFRRLVESARKAYGGDEAAASKARQRWRLPVLLYLVISWLLFIGELAILASRGGTRS